MSSTIIAFILILLNAFVVQSHGYQRFVFIWTGLAMTTLLVVAAHAVSSKAVVMVTLLAAAFLTAIAAYVGTDMVKDASTWAHRFSSAFWC